MINRYFLNLSPNVLFEEYNDFQFPYPIKYGNIAQVSRYSLD